MKNNQDNSHANIDENSIDIIAVLKKLWVDRKFIIKASILFFFIGVVIALLSPVSYTSETTFVPQTSDQSSSSSSKGLGSLASLAGINLNAEAASSLDNYISPLLYSKIVESEEFSLNIIQNESLVVNGIKISVRDYLTSSKKANINPINLIFRLINFIKRYTIDLFINDENQQSLDYNLQKNYNFISDEDYSLINIFKEKFSIEANKNQGYIKVSAIDSDAFVSTQIVNLVTKNLQSSIISLRTNKIKEQLDYSEKQYFKKKKEFETLQNKLARFRDSNKNISTAVFLSELQRLEAEYQLQQNILISLANEYNSNKIKLNKDTPIFSVLDEVSVPNKRSEPKRSLITLIYTFLGLILSISYLLTRRRINEIIEKII